MNAWLAVRVLTDNGTVPFGVSEQGYVGCVVHREDALHFSDQASAKRFAALANRQCPPIAGQSHQVDVVETVL